MIYLEPVFIDLNGENNFSCSGREIDQADENFGYLELSHGNSTQICTGGNTSWADRNLHTTAYPNSDGNVHIRFYSGASNKGFLLEYTGKYSPGSRPPRYHNAIKCSKAKTVTRMTVILLLCACTIRCHHWKPMFLYFNLFIISVS